MSQSEPALPTSTEPDDAAAIGEEDVDSLSQTAEYEVVGKTPKSRSKLALFALFVSLLASAVAGVLLWQYRQFYVELATTDETQDQSLEQVRASVRQSNDALGDVAEDVVDLEQTLRSVDDRVDVLPGRIAGLQQRIDAMQGGSFDVRAQWLRAEAEYYLGVANAELQLANRFENATLALELADDRLQELADPALTAVRDLIADELLALNSVRLVDTAGLSFSLGRLADRSDSLPLRAAVTSEYGDSIAPDASEPGMARLWNSIKDAFGNMIRIERRDENVVPELSVNEQRLIRRQFALELQVARTALASRDAELFKASLSSARNLLMADFDTRRPEVEGALALLDELNDLNIAPERPDISRSLNALRVYGAQ